MPSPHPSSPADRTAPQDRLVGLDVVRGLAVCGILFANIATLLQVFVPWTDMQPRLTTVVLGVLVTERFFPIFSFLFGLGFAIMLASAAVLVLLPLSYVPQRWRPWFPAVAGLVLMVPGAFSGGMLAIPWLFLLGSAVADAGWHRRAERSAVPGLVLAGVGALVAIPMTLRQLSAPEQTGFSAVSSAAGLATAAVYIGLTLALLHTLLRRVLVAFFAPLGRTALTSYVSATLVAVVAGALLFSTPVLSGEPVQIDQRTQLLIWAGCAVFLVVQSLIARWWLARVGQGPLEQLWRAVTWAGAPVAREHTGDGAGTTRDPAPAETIRA